MNKTVNNVERTVTGKCAMFSYNKDTASDVRKKVGSLLGFRNYSAPKVWITFDGRTNTLSVSYLDGDTTNTWSVPNNDSFAVVATEYGREAMSIKDYYAKWKEV